MLNLSLVELKNFLRIDGSEDDVDLALSIEVAKGDLSLSGVPESDSPLYKRAVMLHVAIQYRTHDTDSKLDNYRLALQNLILKLKNYGGG